MNPIEAIKERLQDITLGHTTVVFGTVVTRWAEGSFEVGSIGRNGGVSLERAAVFIVSSLYSEEEDFRYEEADALERNTFR